MLYDDGGRRDGIGGGRKPTQNINTLNCDPITNNTTNKYKHNPTHSNTIVTALKRETKNGYQSMMGQLRICDMYDDYGCNANNNGLTVGLSPPNESLLMQRRLSLKSRSICNPSTDSIQQQQQQEQQKYNHPSPQQPLQYKYNYQQYPQQQPHQRQTPNNIITTKSGWAGIDCWEAVFFLTSLLFIFFSLCQNHIWTGIFLILFQISSNFSCSD